jgi:RNA 3'-terminal phosphate cyclase (ATP)
MLRLCAGGRTTVFTAFGTKGKPSKKVVDEVVGPAESYTSSGTAIDGFLADQLLIYMAMKSHFAKDGETGTHTKRSSYTTNELSTHLTTNIETIKKFLPADFETEHQGRVYRVFCIPV